MSKIGRFVCWLKMFNALYFISVKYFLRKSLIIRKHKIRRKILIANQLLLTIDFGFKGRSMNLKYWKKRKKMKWKLVWPGV